VFRNSWLGDFLSVSITILAVLLFISPRFLPVSTYADEHSFECPYASQPAGWSTWTAASPNTDQSTLAEYANQGPGSYENNAASRACTLRFFQSSPTSFLVQQHADGDSHAFLVGSLTAFAKLLTADQATAYTLAAVIPDWASWVDAKFSSGAD
jgi:hypothetical protein